jgi:hypothetical protein
MAKRLLDVGTEVGQYGWDSLACGLAGSQIHTVLVKHIGSWRKHLLEIKQ